MAERVHQSVGQGRWFPRGAAALAETVDRQMEAAGPQDCGGGRLIGLVAPHAGYQYSGRVAGHAYRALRDRIRDGWPQAIVVLGFSHRDSFPGLALMDGSALVTPLGAARLDPASARLLMAASPAIRLDAAPHDGEHSAENQVPFLQRAAPGIPLTIGLFGEQAAPTIAAVAGALTALARERSLVVVASTDLLHDSDYALVTETDHRTLERMRALDAPALARAWSPAFQPCCGIAPVLALLAYGRSAGARGHLLAYRNSGDDYPECRGDWVVGYGAMAYTVPALGA